ncbi:MAG: ABC-2 family transporter protein, partial [Chloroflexi bacterium]|nr:ABC-2 family transporter protein [Chloroflexota bacterium]
FTLLNPFLADYIQERVSKGLIVLDLLRPIGFLQQMFAGQIGATTGVLPFILAALPFAAVLGSLRPPSSLAALGFYLLSLVLAYLLTALLSLLLGMIAFWTIEMSGFRMIYYFTSKFFAGAFIPLALFPEPLRIVAGILPFQALASLPFSIYLGQLQGPALAQALLTQLAWVLTLGLLAFFIWRLALRRVIIQGG